MTADIYRKKSHHEYFGGNLLKELGYKDWKEIYDHGKLLSTEDLNNKKLILLVEADMKVDIGGEEAGYDTRLEGVARRHGKDSRAYEICSRNVDFLRKLGRP